MMTLKHGCEIRLAPGATELVYYHEWDVNKLHKQRRGPYWIGELYLGSARLICQQAYGENGERKTRAWVRQKCAELLNQIAPGWEIIKTNKATNDH